MAKRKAEEPPKGGVRAASNVLVKLCNTMDLEAYRDGSFFLFIRTNIHRSYIYLSFGKYPRDIHKDSASVVAVKYDLNRICALALSGVLRPLSFYQPVAFVLRQMYHVHTVGPMDRYSSTSCHKTDYLITGYRRAAPGKTYRKIV